MKLWPHFVNSRSSSRLILIQNPQNVNFENKNVKIGFLTDINSKISVVRLLYVIKTEHPLMLLF